MTDKTCKAFLINTLACRIETTSYAGLKGMQALVGGYIETAYQWDNGDTLYVNEEGLLSDDYLGYFTIDKRKDQPFAGNALLVGRELDDGTTAPPQITLPELISAVGFL